MRMSDAVGDLMRDGEPDSESTASELLNAAKRRDAAAWQELLDRHAWLVFQWCRNAGLCANDGADILQSVMTDVAVYLPDFQKDGRKASFRRWLRTITRRKLADFHRAGARQPHGEGGSAAQERMLAAPGAPESSDSVRSGLGPLRERFWNLVERMEDEFEERTWQAFWLTMVENQTSIEAGASLDMTPNAVRLAKWRVLRRLREEAAALEAELRQSRG
jgi:RNA polymerase sigma-70 factor (ECF subfamily)